MAFLHARGFMCGYHDTGIPDHDIDHGDPSRVLAACGLDAAGVAHAIEARFPRRDGSRVKPAA